MHLIELHRVLSKQVEQAAWGGHQHVHAFAQLHHLRVDADPAIHRVAAQRQVLTVGEKTLQHLLGQLTGRHQYQRTHRITRHLWAFHHQPLQHRQGKACGLAGASLRGGHQVAALQNRHDGLRLHGRGGFVIEAVEGA